MSGEAYHIDAVGVSPARFAQDRQDQALGQYVRLRANLAAAKQRLDALGNSMRDLGGELKSQNIARLIGIAFAGHEWLNPDALRSVIQEVVTAHAKLDEARDMAINLGVVIPKD